VLDYQANGLLVRWSDALLSFTGINNCSHCFNSYQIIVPAATVCTEIINLKKKKTSSINSIKATQKTRLITACKRKSISNRQYKNW